MYKKPNPFHGYIHDQYLLPNDDKLTKSKNPEEMKKVILSRVAENKKSAASTAIQNSAKESIKNGKR